MDNVRGGARQVGIVREGREGMLGRDNVGIQVGNQRTWRQDTEGVAHVKGERQLDWATMPNILDGIMEGANAMILKKGLISPSVSRSTRSASMR